MFETHNSYEEQLPDELRSDGIRMWNNVQMRLHIYWFHTVYRDMSSDGCEMSQIVFLTYIDQLRQLDEHTDMKILEVNIKLSM